MHIWIRIQKIAMLITIKPIVMMRISDEECSGGSEVGIPLELDAIGGLASKDSFMGRNPVLKKRILAQLSNSIT